MEDDLMNAASTLIRRLLRGINTLPALFSRYTVSRVPTTPLALQPVPEQPPIRCTCGHYDGRSGSRFCPICGKPMGEKSPVENLHAQSTNRKAIIALDGITKSFGTTPVLKGISFEIMAGEFVAIVGTSGSGKSTLLGIMAGLDKPDSGTVVVDGEEITGKSESMLADFRNEKIGMVFQSFNLLATLTAQENVEIPLYTGKHSGSPAVRARELLEQLGLEDRLKNIPLNLSGGEQQRVAIARALVADPLIVLADEPTGNLDARNRATILNNIDDLRRRTGKTFVIVTHDEKVAERAGRIICLEDGMVVADTGRGSTP